MQQEQDQALNNCLEHTSPVFIPRNIFIKLKEDHFDCVECRNYVIMTCSDCSVTSLIPTCFVQVHSHHAPEQCTELSVSGMSDHQH